MDHLYTAVKPDDFRPKITYADNIFLTGSCFAEHISEKLIRYKYDTLSNPFGILYNPYSLANSFDRIARSAYYEEEELVGHENLFHSMDHHGSFSGKEKEAVLRNINSAIEKARAHLSKAKFVFVSLGTAKVYRYKASGRIAGNNHKIPGINFEELTLSIDDSVTEMKRIVESILHISPQAHIIWTVSPVRHLKGSFVENQRSKAVLILAIDKLMRSRTATTYFPAYEIMMDQLRDYRFYARDMIHPSGTAIDIIWDIFSNTYMEPHASDHHAAMEKIRRAMEHRFLHDNPAAIKTFAEAQLRSIQRMTDLFPEMDWKEERQYFFHLTEPD